MTSHLVPQPLHSGDVPPGAQGHRGEALQIHVGKSQELGLPTALTDLVVPSPLSTVTMQAPQPPSLQETLVPVRHATSLGGGRSGGHHSQGEHLMYLARLWPAYSATLTLCSTPLILKVIMSSMLAILTPAILPSYHTTLP